MERGELFKIVQESVKRYKLKLKHWKEGAIIFNIEIPCGISKKLVERIARKKGLRDIKIGYFENIPEDDIEPIENYCYLELRIYLWMTSSEIEKSVKEIAEVIEIAKIIGSV
jgi:hypothetical protein